MLLSLKLSLLASLIIYQIDEFPVIQLVLGQFEFEGLVIAGFNHLNLIFSRQANLDLAILDLIGGIGQSSLNKARFLAHHP